jgi:hypothetical protein
MMKSRHIVTAHTAKSSPSSTTSLMSERVYAYAGTTNTAAAAATPTK